MPFANGERLLVKYPQKRPLIRTTSRPPQLETPFSVFNEGIYTPNDAFFVRYHISQIPLEIDSDAFRVDIKGSIEKPMTLSLADLKSNFEQVELSAVLQCSGNSRGFTQPRVPGNQLANGAMGNAKWKGVRLKDVLAKAGLKATAKQVVFDGLDKAVLEKTPDFIKSLEVDHANDGEVMLAYEMNGEPLPMLNGFPLRLVVPGHFGTYWIKHLNQITVVDETFKGYWMGPAYTIIDNECGCHEPGTKAAKKVPIKRYRIRSFITNVADGAKLKVGETTVLRGIAFDGGYGLREVLVSSAPGEWRAAALGPDLGKYSFREWQLPFKPSQPGKYELKVRASNRIGQTQPLEPLWNSSGYQRNVVETIRVEVA